MTLLEKQDGGNEQMVSNITRSIMYKYAVIASTLQLFSLHLLSKLVMRYNICMSTLVQALPNIYSFEVLIKCREKPRAIACAYSQLNHEKRW